MTAVWDRPRAGPRVLPETLPPAPAQRTYLAQSGGDPRWILRLRLDAELDGELDAGRLTAALDALTRRHPALRCAHAAGAPGGRRSTTAASSDNAPLIVDLGAGDPAAVVRAVGVLRRRLAIDSPPHLRLAVFRAGRRLTLVYLAHHLAVDGFSLHLLHRELWQRYRDPDRGPAGVDGSYPRYLRALDALRRELDLDAEARSWRRAWGDPPLPVADPVPAANVYRHQRIVRRRIDAGPDRNPGFAAVAAALYRAAGGWLGTRRVAIAHRLLGRRLGRGGSLRRTVGCFALDVPVVLDVDRPPAALETAFATRLGAVSHADVPYAWLALDGKLPYPWVLCPLRLNYTPLPLPPRIGGAVFSRPSFTSISAPDSPRGYLVDFGLRRHRGALTAVVRYARGVHRRGEIEALVEAFQDALRRPRSSS